MLVAVVLSNIISVKSTIEGMTAEKNDKKKKKIRKMPKKGTNVEVEGLRKEVEKEDKKAKAKMSGSDKIAKLATGEDDKDKKESMAPIDYEMSETVEVESDDDDDMIDMQSTQQAAYNNLNKLIGDKGFAKMTQDTEKLMNQQENLAKAMESIGPLVQNAEKMMQGLNLDRFTGMLDKLNGMMGSTSSSSQ